MKVNLQSVGFKADQKLVDYVQEKLDKMQANFESRFGKVEGMDINTTQKFIDENNETIRNTS